ncbi:hypothetical protein MHN80_07430 [Gordonia McavH-238-E]|uniref:hypothetical protein n=1 Tax=Gordonia sp. McavH-238-E TaxID=2917736 RepID=UPI001EF46728|nr:hypothetical protein [Gordonia sp. McavH-238-E]MCG7632141.1 hypothetical protein [Gordonia sp. McavH-238-E]
MGRRTHSSEAAWTPQIAHHVRHELMDLVHDRRRKAYERGVGLEVEAGLLAEELNDADDGAVLLDSEDYADREVELDKVEGLMAVARWWSWQLTEAVLELADTPVRWITASALGLVTDAGEAEAIAVGGELDTRVLATLGRAGVVLFERSIGRHRSSDRLPNAGHGDVGIDGLCWWRATLGEEDAPPVVDMVVVHVLTRDRQVRRTAGSDDWRPAVVEVDSFTVAVEPEWIVSEQACQSVRVLTRLAVELGRGILTVSSKEMTDRSSVATAVVSQ